MWDKQGVLRGACGCGECQEFMSGHGVRCEYCDCSPIKHEKIHTLVSQEHADFSKVTFKSFPEPPDGLKKQGIVGNFETIAKLLRAHHTTHPEHAGITNHNDVTLPETHDIVRDACLDPGTVARPPGTADVAHKPDQQIEAFNVINEPLKNEEGSVENASKTASHCLNTSYEHFDTLDEIVTGLSAEVNKMAEISSHSLELAKLDTAEVKGLKAEPDVCREDLSVSAKTKRGGVPGQQRERKIPSSTKPAKASRAKSQSASLLPVSYHAFLTQEDSGKTDSSHCAIAVIDHSEGISDASDDDKVLFSENKTGRSRSSKTLTELTILRHEGTAGWCHECPGCGRLFSTHERAQRHLIREHKQYKYVCVVCTVLFRHKSAALRHQKLRRSQAVVSDGAIYNVENNSVNTANETNDSKRECDGKNSSPSVLKREKRTAKAAKSHKCLTCEIAFTSGQELRNHRVSEHGSGAVRCRHCADVFPTRTAARKHEKRAHGAERQTRSKTVKAQGEKSAVKKKTQKSYKCDFCDESFPSMRRCKQHEKAGHEQMPFKCPFCDKKYENSADMEDHIETAHTPDDKGDVTEEMYDVTEEVCDVTKSGATEDSNENTGGSCAQCGKGFAKVSLLRRHVSTAHSEQDYLCQYCDKKYRRKHDLIIHERLHTGQRPFTCTVCTMTFRSKNNLQSHQVVHEMRGAYQCQYCGRRFDSKHGMLHHERSHTGEKPYECATCGKRFAHRCVLICHERVHSGERPFLCKYCERGFKDQSTLRKHVRIHTHEKPYKCGYCDRAFNQKWYVKVHEKCHTGGAAHAEKDRKPRKQGAHCQPEVTSHGFTPMESQQVVAVSNIQQLGAATSCAMNTQAVASPSGAPNQQADLTSHQHPNQHAAPHTLQDQQTVQHSVHHHIETQHSLNPLPQPSLPLSTQPVHHTGQGHVITGNHGNASMAAMQSVFPPHHHSMIEIMGQSLETLEQQYNVAHRLFSGYLNTLPASVLGGSASGAPADGSCSGHMPY